jgi:hypothetical protein
VVVVVVVVVIVVVIVVLEVKQKAVHNTPMEIQGVEDV